MDILRLPASLRHAVLRHKTATIPVQRWMTTDTNHAATYSPPFTALPTETPEDSSSLLTLSPTTLNSYTTSLPPNAPQLKYAASYFQHSPPEFLFSAAQFLSFPPSSFPEVAFLGRSNVGKSSLLNALFGRTKVKHAHVSKRPGRTTTMNGFGVTGGLPLGRAPKTGAREAVWKRFPRGGLVVVDMPGYGAGSREGWGTEALKYLGQRKQLRRTFVLVDAEHGLKATDLTLLMHLRQQGISHQIVLSKVDKLIYSGSKPPGPIKLHNGLHKLQDLCASLRRKLDDAAGDGRQGREDILCCSAEKSLGEKIHVKMGIDEVRWAVLSACGLECDELGQKIKRKVDDFHIFDEEN